ncbi:probable G-protein coupled receptor 150 [Callorhinchus milii]|uniref:probable G-protein coupled receptor 150 n=1 Tax=Callorhinchus milii TaxID=7868 RepID=UPI001C3FDA90|nr:probable G-protein coupled receptor 150 [Callorhinchus milii]
MESLMTLESFVQRNFSPALDACCKDSAGNASSISPPPLYNRQIRLTSMALIFALALVGNLAVLHRICCSKRKRRKIDFLITNLAVADLCVSVMTLLSQIIWEALEDSWLAGNLACRCFKVFQVFGLIASSSIIAIIALERHHVIVNPLHSPLPTKTLAATAWICAFMLSIPQAFVFKVTVNEEGEKCLNTFGQLPRWHFQMYIIYGAITVFFIPFCILCVAYTRILWTIWRKERHMESFKATKNVDPKQQRRPIRIIAANSSIPRARVKTLKMTLVIIMLFTVCGLPYFIIEMKVAFGSFTEADAQLLAVLGIFVVSNSAVNPYVYLFFKTNNIYMRRLEKSACFSCLRDYRENTFRREPCAYPAGKRGEHSSTTTSDIIHSVSFYKSPSPTNETGSCDSSI